MTPLKELRAHFQVAGKDWNNMTAPMLRTVRQAKRLIIAIIGLTVLLMGIAMLALPGPAVIVIPIGLGILATEFVWARRLLKKVTNKFKTGGSYAEEAK
jgi:uncharacterized protein (TIGR02611 family)